MGSEPSTGFFTLNPRRKTKNLLLKPFLQLKLPLAVVAVTLGAVGIVAYQTQSAFLELFGYALREVDQPEVYEGLLTQIRSSALTLGTAALVGYVLTVVVICVVYAHKLIGPTVAFRRHVEALKNGDYASRVHIRDGDAFEELAEDLNELASILGEATGSGSEGPDPV